MDEIPSKTYRKIRKKWSVIDKTKYTTHSPIEIQVEEVCGVKLIGYYKNGMLCFSYKYHSAFFESVIFDIPFYVFREWIFKPLDVWIKKTNFKGRVGFECCELEQLNRVIEKMLIRYNYPYKRENGFIYAEFK